MPFYPKDPKKLAQYRQTLSQQAKSMIESRQQEKNCEDCGEVFIAGDWKSKWCPTCREKRLHCKSCGTKISPNSVLGFCRRCSKQTDASKLQRARLHANMFGENNPAKKPGVGAKISAAISGDKHPSRKYPEQWREHPSKYMSYNQSSGLEELVAPYLAGFVPQYKIRFYYVDFADVENKIAIEVQGCWFHNCQQCFPGSPSYKTQRMNARNDARKNTYLTNQGWTIVYLWEHDIRQDVERTIAENVCHK